MNKLFTLIVILALTISVFAQSPQRMSYQCVVRNAGGVLMANQSVGIRISILQGTPAGTIVYQEIYDPNPQTNANGLVTIEIGGGIPITGEFSSINWADGIFFLKTETDPAGGMNYTIVGTSQLLSVPYALYARTSGDGFSGIYNDLTNRPMLFSGNYNDLTNKPILFDGTWTNITGKPTTLTGFGITDGMSTSHAANGITSNMIINWDTAYGWGNHKGLYKPDTYVPTWIEITDKPTFSVVATSGIFADLMAKPVTLAGYGITDAMTTAHAANTVTTGLISNWNTAYGWGNHASADYVPGTRTLTINGTTLNLTANNTWNVGTVTSVGMSLPNIFTVSGSPVTSIGTLTASLTSQTANLIFASPNGTAGTPVFRALAPGDIPNLDWSKITTGKPATLADYGITDAMTTAHAANTITTGLISNWNTAYGWGNHASAGYTILPSQTGNNDKFLTTDGTATSWSALADVAVTGNYNDLINKPINVSAFTNDLGYLTSISVPNQAAGDIMYYDGNNWIRVPKGTDGQILTLQSGVPVWQDPSVLLNPTAPTASAQDASNILLNTVTLNGNVNANGFSTTVIFEHGTTTSYGNTVIAIQSPVTGNETTNVSTIINTLSSNTTYHYRIKVSNAVSITYSNDISFTTPVMPTINGNICIMGNSTIAAYGGQNTIASYLSYTGTLFDISYSGDNIITQNTRWNAMDDAEKLSLQYVFLQIGLNDLDPIESAVTALGRYQTLVNTINTNTPSAKLILGTMIPCKQYLITKYGAVNGMVAYQKWLDMNEAIKGSGVNAIIGMDATASSHTNSLNDGEGNLDNAYDIGDGIHPNNAGRMIIADSWMATFELLQ